MQPKEPDNKPISDDTKGASLEMYSPKPANDDPADGLEPAGEPEAENVDTTPVHWVADEYIHEERGVVWFIAFAIVVIALVALAAFMQEWIFVVLIIVMAAALLVYFRRPPRAVEYTLSINQGLYIGEKLYHFSDFKTFGLIPDHGQHSILLIPTKRFGVAVSVYFPDEVGERIVDIIGARLPMQDLKLDVIDVVVRKLRL